MQANTNYSTTRFRDSRLWYLRHLRRGGNLGRGWHFWRSRHLRHSWRLRRSRKFRWSGRLGRRRRFELVPLGNLEDRRMWLFSRGWLAVGRLLSRGGGHFGQNRGFQFDAGPHLGNGRDRRKFRLLRKRGRFRRRRRLGHCGRRGSSWNLRCTWHFHLGHRRFCRGRERRKSEALALDLMSFNHGLAQVLNVHGGGLTGSRRSLWHSAGRRSRRRWRHRDNAGLFLQMVEQDGVLRSRIGDDAGAGGIEAELAIARAPHPRGRLRRRSSTRRLRFSGAVGAGRGRRRRCRNIAHSGDQFSTHSEASDECSFEPQSNAIDCEKASPYHACTSRSGVLL